MISIGELLNKFDIDLHLPVQVMDLRFEGNYIMYELEMEDGEEVYLFKSDSEADEKYYEIQIAPSAEKYIVAHDIFSSPDAIRSVGRYYGADGICTAIT